MTDVQLFPDFRDLLIEFADAEVDFLLIGGWAMALHGHGRSTDDMDVWIRCDEANAKRVFRALASFGAPIDAHNVSEELFAKPGYGYRMGIKPQLIEILTTISGITYGEAQGDARTFDLDGRTIRYIGRGSLQKNKRAAGRAKDLADLEWLQKHLSATDT